MQRGDLDVKTLDMKQMKKEPVTFALVLFLSGCIVGALACKGGLALIPAGINLNFLDQFRLLSSESVPYGELFWFVIYRNFREFLIIWLLCFTVLGIPYLYFIVIKGGFHLGFLLLLLINSYGAKGFLIFLGFYFPQALIYIPLYYTSIKEGHQFCRKLKERGRSFSFKDIGLLSGKYRMFLLIALGLVVGSFAETYLGSYLLTKLLW